MTDFQADAVRVAAELRAAAPFMPTPEARTTLREAAVLLDVLEKTGDLRGQLDEAQAELARLQREREEERRWMPSGLWLLKTDDGSCARHWVPHAEDETLGQLFPRAALLRHDGAITRAVLALMEEVRASVTRDAEGVPERMTWPSAAAWSARIREEIEKELQPPPSDRAQRLSTGLADVGFHITPEQAQVALDWRTDD